MKRSNRKPRKARLRSRMNLEERGATTTLSASVATAITKITKSLLSPGGSAGQGNSTPTGVSCGYPRVRDWLGAGQERVSHFQSISITSVMSYLKAAKAARKVLRERLKFATVRPTYDPRHPWGVHARTGDQHSPYGPHGTHTRLPFLWEFYYSPTFRRFLCPKIASSYLIT